MKKHKYTREFLDSICADPDYFVALFKNVAASRQDPDYLMIKRKNGDYTMKCIFHKETTPSMRLNCKTHIAKCFGCGKSGDIFTVIQRVKKVPFMQAVKIAIRMKPIPGYTSEGQMKIPFQEK